MADDAKSLGSVEVRILVETRLLAELHAIKIHLQGLRKEVTDWRTHMATTGDFILHEVEALQDILNELKNEVSKGET